MVKSAFLKSVDNGARTISEGAIGVCEIGSSVDRVDDREWVDRARRGLPRRSRPPSPRAIGPAAVRGALAVSGICARQGRAAIRTASTVEVVVPRPDR